MLFVALGEIAVIVLIRPLRYLLGGERSPLGRGVLRLERWILHHLHVMNAESRMRHELDMHGQASSFLADGMSDHTKSIPSVSDTVQRVRDETGATLASEQRSDQMQAQSKLGRGSRQVESSGGERSEDIHEAMLRAQREQRQQAERARRRQSRS